MLASNSWSRRINVDGNMGSPVARDLDDRPDFLWRIGSRGDRCLHHRQRVQAAVRDQFKGLSAHHGLQARRIVCDAGLKALARRRFFQVSKKSLPRLLGLSW